MQAFQWKPGGAARSLGALAFAPAMAIGGCGGQITGEHAQTPGSKPLRIVDTFGISLETSIGHVTGEFWSDDFAGISSPLGDADQHVVRAEDLAALLKKIGVPNDEANRLATQLWENEIAPRRRIWARGKP